MRDLLTVWEAQTICFDGYRRILQWMKRPQKHRGYANRVFSFQSLGDSMTNYLKRSSRLLLSFEAHNGHFTKNNKLI